MAALGTDPTRHLIALSLSLGIGFCRIEWRGHEREYGMKTDGAEERNSIDVAVEEFSGYCEEGAVQDEEDECAVQVAVIHDVWRGRCDWIEDGEGLS